MASKSRNRKHQSSSESSSSKLTGFGRDHADGAAKSAPPKATSTQVRRRTSSQQSRSAHSNRQGAIPEVVSRRMVKRMALFCGLPTLLGLATFPLSYVIVSQGWLELPNVAVLLVSMGGFGLGVLGLSYGALSASWDEDAGGSLLGWPEFRTNFGRVITSWRESRSQ